MMSLWLELKSFQGVLGLSHSFNGVLMFLLNSFHDMFMVNDYTHSMRGFLVRVYTISVSRTLVTPVFC